MKILFVDTTNDDIRVGGGHMYLPGLMGGLVRAGHDVHLAVKAQPNKIVRNQIYESGAIVSERPWKIAGLVEDTSGLFAEWVNRLSPDVYLISGSYDIGWTALPYIVPNIATMMIAHNDSNTFYLPVKHYSEFLTRVVGVSEAICRNFIIESEMNDDSVEWIPYGVETSSTVPHDNKLKRVGPSLIYVGRLDEHQKRISDLIRVIRLLSERGIDFRFDIVGDGEEMPKVKDLLSEQIERGNVVLHGWLGSAEVIDLLRKSDVFTLVSAYEGFCIALVEAMANGCCPVVTDIRSGNKQLVTDGENGFVVPVGDVEAFVEKIVYLAETPEKLLEFRQKAWRTGKQYSVERMVEAYEKCFERAVHDARVTPRRPQPDFPLMESCRSKYPLWLRRIKAKAKSFV